MIKLKEILNDSNIESFVESLEIQPLSQTDIDSIKNLGGRNIPFEVEDKKYKLEINLSLFNNQRIAEVKFYLLNNPKLPVKSTFKNDMQYQIALRKSQLGITDTGNPFKVLTKVLSLLKYYIDTEDIKYITFVADEENRQKLYKSILRRVIKLHNIPYKQCDKNPLTGESLNSEEFWLEKIA